ncbi:hypothetical protein [Virgibacillus halodenitrificans]|nr:hypothetical protein [Virgibacillus halodenitrificans]
MSKNMESDNNVKRSRDHVALFSRQEESKPFEDGKAAICKTYSTG